jgi:hypothetical protein
MVPDVLRSRKKKFLFQILRQGVVFLELQQHNPDLVADALRRSRENLALAAAKWVMFSAEFYLKRIRSIPDYPEYLRCPWNTRTIGMERWFQKVKRFAIKRWDVFINLIIGRLVERLRRIVEK